MDSKLLGLMLSGDKKLQKELTELKGAFSEHQKHGVNNNILINSNFANPVNQRGVISGEVLQRYSYSLDRWKTNNALNLVINSGKSITISNTVNEEFYFFQILDEFLVSELDGKVVTLSAKVNGNIYSVAGTVDASRNNCSYAKVTSEFCSIYLARFDQLQFVFEGNAGATFTIEWAKLELGDHATPYVPRLYAEEFELCNRRFNIQYSIVFPYQIGENYLYFKVPLERKMAQNPTNTIRSFELYANGNIQSDFTCTVEYNGGNVQFFKCSKAGHGFSFSSGVHLAISFNSDAEL